LDAQHHVTVTHTHTHTHAHCTITKTLSTGNIPQQLSTIAARQQ